MLALGGGGTRVNSPSTLAVPILIILCCEVLTYPAELAASSFVFTNLYKCKMQLMSVSATPTYLFIGSSDL
jgi:hypothetical protein